MGPTSVLPFIILTPVQWVLSEAHQCQTQRSTHFVSAPTGLSVSRHPSQILFPDLTFFSGPLSTRQAVCHHPGGHDITSDHFPSIQHWCQINCLYQISHWLLQPLLRKAIMNQCLFTYTNILSWPLWNTPQFLPPSQGETSMSPQVWAEVEASLQKRQVIQGLSLLLTNWVICGPAHSWSQMWQFFHVMNFCCVYLIQI